ncbi:putative ribonuclease H protein [Citrus sinensis]|nr:putative ribonuclease H protein [Citrus sinensis]
MNCDRCGAFKEDALHVPRDCVDTKVFWLNVLSAVKRQAFFSSNLTNWLCMNIEDKIEVNNISNWSMFFGIRLWRIWYWRNQFFFNQISTGSGALMADISLCAAEICKIYNHTLVTGKTRAAQWIRWIPPAWPWCTLNTDRALKANEVSTAGGVIRDFSGRWLSGFGMMIGSYYIMLAELWGLYQGILLAWNLGIRRLKIETDSLCATQIVANSVSDYMANLVFSLPIGLTLYPSPPIGASSILLYDAYRVSTPRSVVL